MRISVASTAFLCVAAAQPISAGPSPGVEVFATFDDLNSVSGGADGEPLGVYRGLNYTSFAVLSIEEGENAIIPQSVPSVATHYISEGAISITAATVKSFDLLSLYFGCTEGFRLTGLTRPEQCTVAFTVYKQGIAAVFQTFLGQYDPTDPVIASMTNVPFPTNFTGLDRVDIKVVQTTLTPRVTAVLIDNVAYKTYSQ
ncbi:hypothetical protein LTR36_009368 [Oleoguttula mirabilis]|uniref:Uncharacterized protein n=1 Tax=Oleoguttula mirabilis TaxID=1507867 RepID=A0AAV9JSJ6_9PEZI|nr:hypothetical protein LTR36_009368 [Oleoguttula mirabilis]